jgi:hypothetical protein
MTEQQADRLLHALSSGIDSFTELARLAELEPIELMPFEEELERAINLFAGFYKFAAENMKPAGLPPPANPYWNREMDIDLQPSEYYAFEAVQRGAITRERCIWTCGQFGIEEKVADQAIDTVVMPWHPKNGWRSFARVHPENGRFILQIGSPVKLKRHIERLRAQLLENRT